MIKPENETEDKVEWTTRLENDPYGETCLEAKLEFFKLDRTQQLRNLNYLRQLKHNAPI